MFAVVLLASLALAADPTDCCGGYGTYDKDKVAYTDCVIDKAANVDCPTGWAPNTDGDKCETNTLDVTDCTGETGVTANPMKCEAVQTDIGLDKCGEAGVEGATNSDDFVLLGCCGDILKREPPKCLCDEGLLDTYKTISYTVETDTETFEVTSCGELEVVAGEDQETCNEAFMLKDVAALGCCVEKADSEKAADPVAKAKKDIKKGEDVLVVTQVYVDAECKTLFMEKSESVKLDTCTETMDENGDKMYFKAAIDDACAKSTLSYFTDAECKTAKKETKDGKEVDMVEEETVDDKCDDGEKELVFCEAVTDSGDGSGVSMLSALVVLITAAFYY